MKRVLPVLLLVILTLGYTIYSASNRLPQIKTEGVTVMELNSPSGQVIQAITDKNKIAQVVRYYSSAKVLAKGSNDSPGAILKLKLFDRREINISPLAAEKITVGIKKGEEYQRYHVQSPELASYLANLPKQ